MCQGFACFFVDAARSVPVCVPPLAAAYGVATEQKLFRRRMGMFRDGCSEPDPRALFSVLTWPSVAGEPASSVASYRREHAFRSMVELNTAIADGQAARPLIYTTMSSDAAFDRRHVYRGVQDAQGSARDATLHLRSAGLDAGDLYAGAHADSLRMMNDFNAAHAGSIAQQQRLAQDLNRGVLDPRNVRIDPLSGLPVFDANISRDAGGGYNVVPLPVDSKVEATVLPSSRRDLVALLDHIALSASFTTGVPPAVMGMQRAHASDRVADEAQLRSALALLKNTLESCLLDVYVALWGEKKNLGVTFPSFQDTNSIEKLYASGVLEWEAYCQYTCSRLGITRDQLAKDDPRLQDKEPKPKPKPKPKQK